jgi:hypothetical protein
VSIKIRATTENKADGTRLVLSVEANPPLKLDDEFQIRRKRYFSRGFGFPPGGYSTDPAREVSEVEW